MVPTTSPNRVYLASLRNFAYTGNDITTTLLEERDL